MGLSLLMLAACQPDPATPGPTGTQPTLPTGTPTGGGFLDGQFCDVQAVLQTSCVVGCHSGLVPEGGLNLETDAWTALVNAPSVGSPGETLVVPGDPESSLLYRKITGLLALGEGDVMPPTGALDAGPALAISQWIRNGAPDDCQLGVPPETSTGTGPHHPPGWDAAEVHGPPAKLQTDGDCRSCHGADLTGGIGNSCDECHEPGWRTNCTYCHGGVTDTTGAPPDDIDGVANPAEISFPPHHEHVYRSDHLPYDCTQCHLEPANVLSPGHVFDDYTPRYGEVNYAGGIARYATYLDGTCSNVYCHGTGLANGTAYADEGPMSCYSCHPDSTSTQNEWLAMSGRHKQHLDDTNPIVCYDCHSSVVDAAETIVNPDYHVDGYPQIEPVSVVWDGATCTGNCHNHAHSNEGWE